jgi:hypothetical protein
MALVLIRSEGLSVKTWPVWIVGNDHFLDLHRPEVENTYVSPDFALAEIEYTLGELATYRPQSSTAVDEFRRYLASMEPETIKHGFGTNTHLLGGVGFRDYLIPKLPDRTKIDWCGVIVDPTDFLHAARYVITNTPIEAGDPRPAFIQAMREQVSK